MEDEPQHEWQGAGCAEVATITSPTQAASKTDASQSDAKWMCSTCTYENFPAARRCTMCRAAKPLLGEDIFRLQETEGASAMPVQPAPECNTESVGAICIEERLRPLRISSPHTTPPGASATKWPCPVCTYENWPKSVKCAMCGAAHAPSAAEKEKQTRNKLGVNDLTNELDNANNRRSMRRNDDWVWLQACLGVVEDDAARVEAYLSSGGDPARALTLSEAAILDRASAFDAGHTLVHLAIRFQREDILATLLSRISGGGSGVKRAPSYIAPDIASAIRRHVTSIVRQKKTGFQCKYLQEFATFSLPAEIDELPAATQEQLFTELLDREAQQTLEADPPLINWSLELTVRLGSRLYALWNRSAGDCLLDATMQAAWGVFDRENTLRRALADSLHQAGRSLYERWHAWECLQAAMLEYTPEEEQLRSEWSRLVAAAATPGTPLHQMHVFALAHVMRRPIIVYGVNVVNSYKGEAIGYANFQGVYLPLIWGSEVCSKSPLCLGYTRGHFSALVPMSRYSDTEREENEDSDDIVFLPLTDSDGKLLPVHYLDCDEMSDEEGVLRRWLQVCVSSGGLLAARQTLHMRPLLVAQLLEEWLNHYRTQQPVFGPFPPRLHPVAADFSSDGDTDDE